MPDLPTTSAAGPTEAPASASPAATVPAGRLVRADGRGETAPSVERYDFRNPVFLSEVDLRRLRLQHEDFVRYLAARLSLYLRMEFGLKITGLTTTAYSKFTEALQSPTHVCMFKVEPLIGVGLMEIKPKLALTIADRLLGGKGLSVKAERSLTEIEVALIEDVIMVTLEEWSGQWKSDQPLRTLVIGHENGGRFLQTSPKEGILLVLAMDATFGDCTEQIQIGVPYYLIEPMVKKLLVRQKGPSEVHAEKPPVWNNAFDKVTVPLRAEWQTLELSLREVASLRLGDVIEMPPSIFSDTRVMLNGSPKFVATVGLDTDRVALQLTRKLRPDEIPHAKPDGSKKP